MTCIIINDVIDFPPAGSKPLPTQGNCWLNLLACLGYAPDNPPLGDFLARYHKLDGHWLALTPIHWEASHNNASIIAIGNELGFSEDESRLVFAYVADFMAEQGIQLHYHDAQIWLMNIDDKVPIQSESVWAMRHQPMMSALQQMDGSLYWSRLMTELQMLLSAHPFNQSRKRDYPVNGVWFYGDAFLDTDLLSKAHVITDDPTLMACFPQMAQAYTPGEPIGKNTILFLTENSNPVNCKYPIRWFWNNIACLTTTSAWWKTLWKR